MKRYTHSTKLASNSSHRIGGYPIELSSTNSHRTGRAKMNKSMPRRWSTIEWLSIQIELCIKPFYTSNCSLRSVLSLIWVHPPTHLIDFHMNYMRVFAFLLSRVMKHWIFIRVLGSDPHNCGIHWSRNFIRSGRVWVFLHLSDSGRSECFWFDILPPWSIVAMIWAFRPFGDNG